MAIHTFLIWLFRFVNFTLKKCLTYSFNLHCKIWWRRISRLTVENMERLNVLCKYASFKKTTSQKTEFQQWICYNEYDTSNRGTSDNYARVDNICVFYRYTFSTNYRHFYGNLLCASPCLSLLLHKKIKKNPNNSISHSNIFMLFSN